jgi:sirohydrochlorin cobaltochelatase
MTTSPPADVAVVFVAHGSRADAANDAHRGAAERLAADLGLPVVAAFLELSEPSIPDAIVAAADDGAARVLVLPLFLYPGRHLVRDIPALVGEAQRRRPAATVEVLDAFGADPAIAELLAAQVRRAMS